MRAQNHPSTIFEYEDFESNDDPRLTSFLQKTGQGSIPFKREDLKRLQKRSCEAVISVKNKVGQIIEVFRRDIQTSLIETVRDIQMQISHMQDKYSAWTQRQDRYFQKEPIQISPSIQKKNKKDDLKGQIFKKRKQSNTQTKASEQQYNLENPIKSFKLFQQRKPLLQSVPFDEDELELTVKSMIEKELQCSESNRKQYQKRLTQTMIEEKTKHHEQLRKEVKKHEEEIQMIRENYSRLVQGEVIKHRQMTDNLEQGYRNKIDALERNNFMIKRQLEEKLAQKQKSLCKMVSNSIEEHPDSFNFIVSSIESFTEKKIKKSQLVFQNDRHNHDIGFYLAELKQSSSPFCAIFFTATQQIFGVFSPYISINETGDHHFNAFLFNVNTKRTFLSNANNNVYICPVSFVDNLLVIGNRQVYLRNHKLETIIINCGNIIGLECFRIRKTEILKNANQTQIELLKVQLHKISFQESQ